MVPWRLTLRTYFSMIPNQDKDDSEFDETTIDLNAEAVGADDEECLSSSSVSGRKRKVSICERSRNLAKRRRESLASSSSSSSKQRTSGISTAWKTEFSWLEETDGDGMVCTLCRKFSRRPQKCVAGKATWVDLPCRTIRRSALVAHKESKSQCSDGSCTSGFQEGWWH